MKIPAIKKLVETYNVAQLLIAEEQINEEKPIGIEVEGEDEGEKLTHIFAAIWILEKMKADDINFNTALRAYTQKVRNSIS